MSDHPRLGNRVADEPPTWSERIARKATRGMGSLSFIAVQTVVIVVWITFNVVAVVRHWDPYPFILLNLLFSTQAAYAAPLILLSQNKQEDRDHAAAAVERREVDDVDAMTIEQMQILREMRQHVADHAEELRLLRAVLGKEKD
jgi:uncharacterized membrane protein